MEHRVEVALNAMTGSSRIFVDGAEVMRRSNVAHEHERLRDAVAAAWLIFFAASVVLLTLDADEAAAPIR